MPQRVIGVYGDFLHVLQTLRDFADIPQMLFIIIQPGNQGTAQYRPGPGGIQLQEVIQNTRVIHSGKNLMLHRITGLDVIEKEVNIRQDFLIFGKTRIPAGIQTNMQTFSFGSPD